MNVSRLKKKHVSSHFSKCGGGSSTSSFRKYALKSFLMIGELDLLKVHAAKGKEEGDWKASFC